MGDIDEEGEGAEEEEESKGGWWDIQIPQLRKECLERDIEDQGDKAGWALSISMPMSHIPSLISSLISDHLMKASLASYENLPWFFSISDCFSPLIISSLIWCCLKSPVTSDHLSRLITSEISLRSSS